MLKRAFSILFPYLLLGTLTLDLKAQTSSIGGVINQYTPIVGLLPCENIIVVENAGAFFVNDTVLIIQMQGAVIDSSNTNSFGQVTIYNNVGNYEYNFVKSVSGNNIELKNKITRTYDIPTGKVQLIRVPYYQNATVISTLSCLPWDGQKGGVLAFNTEDLITLSANITVNGAGFRGGIDPVTVPSSYNCYQNNFYYPVNPDLASGKGESFATISADKSFGKGAIASGGGGGNSHNSGGGGGGNSGSGGFGGYNFEGSPCDNTPFDNRGIGGRSINFSNTDNRILMGGGGGAGHTNNPQAFEARGGNGAGIILITGNRLVSNGFKITANGNDGVACAVPSPQCHEGMGGGGAGGTIVLDISNYTDNTVLDTKGGKGADMVAAGFLKVGPGGGGGGGKIIFSNPAVPANVSVSNSGGINGVATGYSNDPFGATSGATGTNLFNIVFPIDLTPFRPNIDSVRINDLKLSCNEFDFRGLGYVNTNPVASWQWSFGDGGTASTQDAIYSYSNPGPFTVKLVVTDINGCIDSISKLVNPSFLTLDAGPGDTICTASSTQLQSQATGAVSYSWIPAAYLNNPTIPDPQASPPATTLFYLTATNAQGCSQTDSVLVNVRADAGFAVNPPLSTCLNSPVQLSASGGDLYSWTPAGSLSNANISNPNANPLTSTTYTVDITDTLCGLSTSLSTSVQVRPLPVIRASRSNDIDCSVTDSRLNASGALSYHWTPAGSLSNPLSASPLASPLVTTSYVVTGTDGFGCAGKDSVIVKVSADNKALYQMPTAFTPNNDGLNDCYGVKLWGQVLEIEFSIYNRWGERVFYTRNPSACWDGTVKGVPQNPAVFVYMIKARTSCQDHVFRKGTFALIR